MSPPPEVLAEFLHRLSAQVSPQESVLPVVRGSFLLQHWFANRARPAADLDIEVFTRTDDRGRRFTSAVDHVRQLCSWGLDNNGWPTRPPSIFFDDPFESEHPQSLWTYGTPGTRFFVNWSVQESCQTGRLQLDIAQSNSYTPDDLGVTNETFIAPGGVTFQSAAYSPEAMLAAKVSWLVRGIARGKKGQVVWSGEPKDLFDAHLLASDKSLQPEVFRRAMLAVGTGDALDWNEFDVLFDVRRETVTDDVFGNWVGFAERYPKQVRTGPVELWAELADRLELLLGDLCPLAEMPFLAAVNSKPDDALPLLVYADWLDERDDPRGQLVRQIAAVLVEDDTAADRRKLRKLIAETSQPWLHQLFGTTARLQLFRASIGMK